MTIKKWSGTAWVDQYVATNVSSIVASGTPSSSTFLRGDGQWITPTNNFVSTATFASNTLTLNRQGLTALTVDLSSLATDANNFLTGVSGSGNGTVTFTRSGLTNLTWNASHTHDDRYYTESEADTRFVNTTGDTMSGSLTVNNNISANRYYQIANGVPTSNLGTPSVTEMALFDEQFDNKTAFYNIANLKFYTSPNNVTWTEYTGFSDVVKRKFLGGDNDSGVFIPNLTNRFRIEITNSGAYVYLNALYLYWSSNSHNTQVHIYRRTYSNQTWSAVATSGASVSAWPGHLYLPFSTIPFAQTFHNDAIRIEFIPTWSTGQYANSPISLNRLQLWGGYPAGRRNIYSIDEVKNVYFPALLTANRLISNVATGTAPLTVTSTTAVANLNADLLDGLHSSSFVSARTRADWNTATSVIGNVVGELAWKNYGNNHTIFDASNSTSPSGTAKSNTNPDIFWSATYPTLMGWNGTNTYGVRVDSSRAADTLSTARTLTIGSTGKTFNGSADVSWSLTDIGLGNVNNTSDANKPVSTAQQTALNLKANLASPTFTGTVSGITATMVGLGNVTNQSKATMFASPTFTGTVSGVTKTHVGLGNVDNTSDANKPVSTAQQTALNLKLNTSLKGANSGLAELDSSGKVPAAQLPSYVDDVVMFDPLHNTLRFASTNPTGTTAGSLNEILYSFQSGLYYCCSVVSPPSGYVWTSFGGGGTIPTDGFETGKIYVTTTSNKTYRWSTAQPKDGSIVEISASLALGSTSATAHRGDHGATAYTHSQVTNGTNPHGTTFANIAAKPTTLSGFGITDAEPAFTKNTGFNKNFGTTAGTVTQGNDARLSNARTPTAHTHGNITNAGAIGSTTNLVVVTGTSGVLTTASRDSIDSRTAFPTTYANITGTVPTWNQSTTGNAATATTLQNARTINGVSFNGSANITITAAPDAHTHAVADVTGLQDALNLKAPLASPTFTGNVTVPNVLVGEYIYHSGDTNTYIRFLSSDDMQLMAGGRQMLRMDEGTDPDRLRFVTDDNWTDSNGNWNMSGSLTVGGNIAVSGTVDGVDIAALNTTVSQKANLASPALTGIPTAPTASFATNTTQLATTAFVQTALSGLVASAPTTLDTLNELAAALGDDPNFATTVSTSIGTKVTANTAITAGTATKITFDTKGLVTGGTTLAAGDIPNLDTAKITSGTFADARIPNLNASKITAGTFGVVRGGTGATTLASGEVLIGAGTGAVTTLSRSGIDSRTAFPTTYANITGTVPTWNQSTTGNAATATLAADSSLLNGFASATGTTANTIVRRDANGYIYGSYINSSRGNETTAAASYIYDTGDGWLRKKTLANAQTEIVSSAAVTAHAPSKTGTGASGTWSISVTGSSGSTTGNAATATTLATGRTLTIGNTGKSFNGSAPVSWTLAEIGAQAAGSYAAASHNHDASHITTGTIDVARLPAIAITDTFTGTTLANFVSTVYSIAPTSVQKGDILILTTDNRTYVHNGGTAGTSADFTLLRTPTDLVTSVASKQGAVTLVKGDVGLGNVDNTADSSKTVANANRWTSDRTITIGNTGKTVNGTGNVSWTLAEIGATNNTGTVTSVGLSLPTSVFTGTGSVTTSGTLTRTFANQSANTVFAGPTTGLPGVPAFRTLVAEDLPTHTHSIANVTGLQTALDGKAASAHTHGNITNAGAIGTTASLPIITTTSGVLTTGSFGTTAGTFAQGNDSRLSNARTPLSHSHGNITNEGAIGTTTGQAVITGAFGVLTTTSRSGIDTRTSFPPSAHTHGFANITGIFYCRILESSSVSSGSTTGVSVFDISLPIGTYHFESVGHLSKAGSSSKAYQVLFTFDSTIGVTYICADVMFSPNTNVASNTGSAMSVSNRTRITNKSSNITTPLSGSYFQGTTNTSTISNMPYNVSGIFKITSARNFRMHIRQTVTVSGNTVTVGIGSYMKITRIG